MGRAATRGGRRCIQSLGHWLSGGCGHRLQFGFDGGDVSIDQLLQQADLQHVEMLAALTELVVLEQRQFMGQLLVALLAVAQRLLLCSRACSRSCSAWTCCSTRDINSAVNWSRGNC